MNKKDFTILMDSLQERIDDCQWVMPQNKTQLENLTLREAANLKNFVHTELETMDRIAMVDLYHVIGMGNLSPQQMMKFTYAMREYLAYRPFLKAFEANGFTDLNNLPDFPTGAKFHLLKLGPLTLHLGEETAEEEVEDFFGELHEDILTDSAEAPYTLDCRKGICVKSGHIEDFCMDLGLGGAPGVLERKIKNRSVYLGIDWNGYDAEGNACGTVSTTNVYKRLQKILKEKYKVGLLG